MKILTNIPIIGDFKETSLDNHKGAMWELAYSIMISTMPLWVAMIAMELIESGYTFYQLLQNGELYIYSATTLAPVIYLVTKDRYNSQKFPSRHLYTMIVWIIAILSTIIITMQRVKNLDLSTNWISGSIGIYLFSIFILYTVLVYNNKFLPNPASKMREDENNFLDQFRIHRNK